MNRKDILLVLLAAAEGRLYSPAQLQKSLFLITENLPDLCAAQERYNFRPYDYGPFDSAVYEDIGQLEAEGLAISQFGWNGRWKECATTDDGLEKGKDILIKLDEESRRYIIEVSKWVRGQSFQSLVKSIYEQYPDMKKNSIFQY